MWETHHASEEEATALPELSWPGKPRELPLKALFWVKRVTHPFLPFNPHCSPLRCAVSAQSAFPGECRWASLTTLRQLNLLLPLV